MVRANPYLAHATQGRRHLPGASARPRDTRSDRLAFPDRAARHQKTKNFYRTDRSVSSVPGGDSWEKKARGTRTESVLLRVGRDVGFLFDVLDASICIH